VPLRNFRMAAISSLRSGFGTYPTAPAAKVRSIRPDDGVAPRRRGRADRCWPATTNWVDATLACADELTVGGDGAKCAGARRAGSRRRGRRPAGRRCSPPSYVPPAGQVRKSPVSGPMHLGKSNLRHVAVTRHPLSLDRRDLGHGRRHVIRAHVVRFSEHRSAWPRRRSVARSIWPRISDERSCRCRRGQV